MKIVMLNGQNHKGSTYHIGRMIADKIAGDNEILEFFFPKDLNHFCMGCYRCIEDEKACPYYEEKKVILDAIEEADVLIATTPTYCMHVSASLKALIDMMFDYWMVHRPKTCMFGKRMVIVSTSAGASPKSAMKDVEDAFFNMGVPSITKYGIAVQAMNWDTVRDSKKKKIDKDTTRIARKLGKNKKPHVGIKTRLVFGMMRMMQKNGWGSSPVEKVYWEKNGWFGRKRPWKSHRTGGMLA